MADEPSLSPFKAVRLGLASAAQVGAPGLYAWAVTVAPVFWLKSAADTPGRVAAFLALLTAVAAPFAQNRWGPRLRHVGLWAFVGLCASTWLLCPETLSPAKLDPSRLLAGMVGWGLFAFSAAAPAVRRHGSSPALLAGSGSHAAVPAGDSFYLAGGALAAAGLQIVGTGAAAPERQLLVRFVTLAAGIAVLGACGEVALARHAPSPRKSAWSRVRSALVPIFWLAILGLVGLLLADEG